MEYARIAPFKNQEFYVTSIFGEDRTSSIHTGIDIATPTSAGNAPLYSVKSGVVTNKGTDSYGGIYLAIKGNDNIGILYYHLQLPSPLNVGDRVLVGQYVGNEGSTGLSTGIHLHFAMQDMTGKDKWNFSTDINDYLNPADFMGISNVKGTKAIYIYNPPTPSSGEKTKFKWVLFTRKIRKMRNN